MAMFIKFDKKNDIIYGFLYTNTNTLLCYNLFLLEIDGQFVHQLILNSIKIIKSIYY